MLGLTWISVVATQLSYLLVLHLLSRSSSDLRSLTIMEMSQGIIGKPGRSSIITRHSLKEHPRKVVKRLITPSNLEKKRP